MTCQGNVTEVCRVCLKNSDNITNIFRTKINSVLVAEIVSICSSSYIWEEDGMPSTVCAMCLRKLESYWELRNCIKTSENILRSGLETRSQRTVDMSNLAMEPYDKQLIHDIVPIDHSEQSEGCLKIAEDITIKVEPDSFRDMLLVDINNIGSDVKPENDLNAQLVGRGMLDFVMCNKTSDSRQQQQDKVVEEVVVDAHKILSDVLELDMGDVTQLKDGSNDPKNSKSKRKRQKDDSSQNVVADSNLTNCLQQDCNDEDISDFSGQLLQQQQTTQHHKQMKHAKIKCRSCKKSFSPDKLKLHNDTVHTGSKMFKCQICNSYISLKYYDMHMAVHA